MSSQQQSSHTSYSSSSSTSYSSSSTGTNGNGVTTGYRETQSSYTDPSGTTVQRARQNLGEPAVQEERRYDGQGRELTGGGGGTEGRRIDDVSAEEQAQRDRQYEEAIEEEYAKREGGA